jgi:hypothetical protein
MFIEHDQDEWETVVDRRVCPFHESNPGEAFSGCTCSFGMSTRRRDPDKVHEIKAKRQRERENEVLRQAMRIIAERMSRPRLIQSHPIEEHP